MIGLILIIAALSSQGNKSRFRFAAVGDLQLVEVSPCLQFGSALIQSKEDIGGVIIVSRFEYDISPPVEYGELVVFGIGERTDMLDDEFIIFPIAIGRECIENCDFTSHFNCNFLLRAMTRQVAGFNCQMVGACK